MVATTGDRPPRKEPNDVPLLPLTAGASLVMRIICIDVIVGIETCLDTALDGVRKALWVVIVARLTLDVRVITAANRRLIAALANWAFTERLFGSPNNKADG